jgi:pyruvate/2-oxoglutarate dehydrogenase complex dihydrolipoamide acyltransferase (E2) component
MKTPIVLQGVGLVEQITVAEWLFAAGEKVKAGDTVVNIETEKATVGVAAPADGVLEITVAESPELVPADAVLGYVSDEA